MRTRYLAVALLAVTSLVLANHAALAADVYLIRFVAQGPGTDQCHLVSWLDDTVLHNSGSSPATIRLVSVSNGGTYPDIPSTFPSFTLDTGSTVALRDQQAGGNWIAVASPLWVVHITVPDGVIVASRALVGVGPTYVPPTVPPPSCPGLPPYPTGVVALPVFHSLVPASTPQVHLGADLGARGARINVGVYNGGSSTVAADIDVYEACDDALLLHDRKSVPPDTLSQFPLEDSPTRCPEFGNAESWEKYVVVTATEPSLSYVTILATDFQPTTNIGVGVVR
jgi:hypothetical protein